MKWDGLKEIYDFVLQMEWIFTPKDPCQIINLARASAERIGALESFERINPEDFMTFSEDMKVWIDVALVSCEVRGFKALCFEYDLDNDWSSHFSYYHQDPTEDQDGFCDHQGGLSLGRWSEIGKYYSDFATTPKDAARTIGLVAYTVSIFAQHLFIHQKRLDQLNLRVFVGFHDQSPVTRLY